MKWVRRKPAFIVMVKLVGTLKVLTVSDAVSRREDKSGLAMRGAVIALSEVHPGRPDGQLHLIDWYNRRQRRVVRSIFGAELH